MKTRVEFRSAKFPAREGEDEQINPGRHGKALADHLRAALAARGIPTAEPRAEDWGWAIPVESAAGNPWIGCGNLDGVPDGFLCFVEPSNIRTPRFRRKIGTGSELAKIANALEAILLSDPGVHDVQWQDDDRTT